MFYLFLALVFLFLLHRNNRLREHYKTSLIMYRVVIDHLRVTDMDFYNKHFKGIEFENIVKWSNMYFFNPFSTIENLIVDRERFKILVQTFPTVIANKIMEKLREVS